MYQYIKSYRLFESRSAQEIISDIELAKLGLLDSGIRLITARVELDNLVPSAGAEIFIKWRLGELPAKASLPNNRDSWVDVVRNVPGIDLAGAADPETHTRNLQAVWDYLFLRARQHRADVLHVRFDNQDQRWYGVATGERLPDLGKL
jgi:hypothetical protein